MPVKVLDVDLHDANGDLPVDGAYASALVLVRWRRLPLVQLEMPVADGRVVLTALWSAASKALGGALRSQVAESVLFGDRTESSGDAAPSCSVIVCTRDRPQDLQRCLESIMRCRPAPGEIIVVDNVPPDDATARVARAYPVKYVVEPRKGLNWARTSAIRAAAGELLLFTDDDVVVDVGWVGAMCKPFDDPECAAVTGLVLALELETPTQEEFERFVGFSRGFEERRFTASNLIPAAAGNAGAGASMALRGAVAKDLDLFAHEIDCGTAAMSGGDNYAFYQLLRNGFAICYTPEAVCWHRHRRTDRELVTTMQGYSVGVYAFLLRCFVDHGDWQAVRVGVAWFFAHHVRNAARALLKRPEAIPLRYTAAEIKGVAGAWRAYRTTRKVEREFRLNA